MELFYKILDKSRYFMVGLAGLFLIIGMVFQYDWAYIAMMITVVIAIITDLVKMGVQKKLGIPVTKRENMFKLKKRK